MIYLICATISSALVVIILKMIKMRGENVAAAIAINYIIGAIMVLALSPVNVASSYIIHSEWGAISIIIGVMFMISLAIYAFSAAKAGVAVTTISGRAAMAVPVVFAFVALGEKPTAMKIILLATILFSLWLILKQDNKVVADKSGGSKKWLAAAGLPLLVFCMTGVNDTMMQYAKKVYVTLPDDNMLFLGVMFIAASIAALLFYLFENRGRMPLPSVKSVLWGVLLGIMNTVCCIGILYSLERMDGSVFFPLYYSGAVIITTVVGVGFFKEKLSVTNYVGIALALTAIVFLASQ